ncbi:hypothetical protein [Candidatus Nitrosocosmicus franklandus]|nr:hypothetical protein [Candidatus Nitrosocosmicus franklandus]
MVILSLIYFTITPVEFSGISNINYASAQELSLDSIQITSTSTYTDEFGSFHIIGEVNNTSTQPQTNIIITAILSNLATNSIVGNYSALSSIETLRSGELSPFDIVIQNPQQILGTFDFMEFSVTSESALAEKPANLVLNGSSSFVDNVGNPHITGNIINKGQAPEQFINLVATFYDNSSLGVVGTQSFGLDIGNLPSNQMVPFDITITDNKTKSQGAFYSLNVDSVQSSMSPPLNQKFSLSNVNSGAEQFLRGNELTTAMLNNNQGIISQNLPPSNDNDNVNDNDNDNQRGEQRRDDNGNPWFDDDNCSEEPGSSGGELSECEEAEREEQSEQEDEDPLDNNNGNDDTESEDLNNNDETSEENDTNQEDDTNQEETN